MKQKRILSRPTLLTAIAALALLPITLPAQSDQPDNPPPPTHKNPPPKPPNFRPPPPPKVAPQPPTHRRDRDGEGHREHGKDRGVASDLLVLDRILAMEPEQLSRIREAIERVEKMSAEEREQMRNRLHQFRHLSPERRQEVREKWRSMTPAERREKVQELRERHWKEFFSDPDDSHKETPGTPNGQ